MNIFQVSFYIVCPGATFTEEDIKTAFVRAISFNEAVEKVEILYRKEFESARVFAVSITDAEIIL